MSSTNPCRLHPPPGLRSARRCGWPSRPMAALDVEVLPAVAAERVSATPAIAVIVTRINCRTYMCLIALKVSAARTRGYAGRGTTKGHRVTVDFSIARTVERIVSGLLTSRAERMRLGNYVSGGVRTSVEFRVLGAVEMHDSGRLLAVGPPQQRHVDQPGDDVRGEGTQVTLVPPTVGEVPTGDAGHGEDAQQEGAADGPEEDHAEAAGGFPNVVAHGAVHGGRPTALRARRR